MVSVEVENVALPLLSATEPRLVAPSLKVMVPLGVPAPGATAVTVAVKVTFWPKTAGFAEEIRVVAVLAAFTTSGTMLDVLEEKFASPP